MFEKTIYMGLQKLVNSNSEKKNKEYGRKEQITKEQNSEITKNKETQRKQQKTKKLRKIIIKKYKKRI